MSKLFPYKIIALFVVVFLCFDTGLGYAACTPWYCRFTYMWQHASLPHLCFNSFSFLCVMRLLGHAFNRYTLLAILVSCAFAASFFAVDTVPTVGSSGMIHAALGLYVVTALGGTKMRVADKSKFALFWALIFTGLMINLLHHGSNVRLHLCALLAGMAAGVALEVFYRLKMRFSRQASKKTAKPCSLAQKLI